MSCQVVGKNFVFLFRMENSSIIVPRFNLMDFIILKIGTVIEKFY